MTQSDVPIMLPLIVAQYQAVHHPREKQHWVIAALESRMHAHVFELTGGPASYAYATHVEERFGKAPHLRGGYQLGFINPRQLAWLKGRLEEVPIMRDDVERFNSQVWVISALQMLKEEGVITGDIGYRHVREELELEMQRWEVADDTLEERLFP
ncbi:hypothetical protein CYLTODRAFT_425627 [Cylindrobasidium torrendii FP15055 ss-10]|uniref:Uncharacterized protein n=1 Tax=Cylindrobasidium torrendii FP15055 ss-10 TaxID=1314674 RepID=A0A0D7B031_9AGAR|nr:hypothetical protein CYLTODRAFT_425627 [Cylindrobasidium torrendii FP15055 ss-10]